MPIPLDGRLLALWDRLRAAYWFIPALMATAAVVLALVLPLVDARLGTAWLDSVLWAHASRPEGARAMLSAIASSMIAVAGVVFSTTIATVTFAAGQLGPRLLANFMRDRRNQFVLGTFTATYLYCLLVMRTIQSAEEAKGELVREAFVPNLSVLVGLGLAVLSIGVLIFFVHHAPRSVHTTSVVARLGEQLMRRLTPGDENARSTDGAAPSPTVPPRHRVPSPSTGYIQTIDLEDLVDVATQHDLVVFLPLQAGAFATVGTPLLLASPAERVTDEAEKALQAAFVWGDSRTPAQDPLFFADELVEIAARALSPGINDPFTANTCFDWLGSAAVVLARTGAGPSALYDDAGAVRLVVTPITFEAFLERTFAAVRPYASSDRNATLHLLTVFGRTATALTRTSERDALRHHVDTLIQASEPTFALPADREVRRRGYEQVLRLLDHPDAVPSVLPTVI